MGEGCRRQSYEDNFNVVIGMKYGVASFSSWSKFICNPKTGFTRIRGSMMITASF